MADEDSDTEDRGGDRPRSSGSSGFEDRFWLVVLALIVAVLFLIGLTSADTGPANPGVYPGWH
ncbi:hypothetical protein [Streptomyces sp. NPDC058657]|uniref:hypothetical protein n=1 Tax=unclassified Streptomyces TaxID=2593676 RepID=UPI00365B9F8A